MSYDWTKEELLQELNERKAEGESEEMTFDFIWAVVERAYQERDHPQGERGPMTNEQQNLAERLVACKGWRWMPGMLTDEGRRVMHVWPDDLGIKWSHLLDDRVVRDADAIPDLTDAATLGCLLALVREAWGDPTLCVVFDTSDGRWHVGRWEDGLAMRGREGDTEAEALVDALESAPPTPVP